MGESLILMEELQKQKMPNLPCACRQITAVVNTQNMPAKKRTPISKVFLSRPYAMHQSIFLLQFM